LSLFKNIFLGLPSFHEFKFTEAHSKKEVAGRKNSSGSASMKKVCHCEERKRRSNLDRKDCFASLAMTRSHLWGIATILANTFFRECTQFTVPFSHFTKKNAIACFDTIFLSRDNLDFCMSLAV